MSRKLALVALAIAAALAVALLASREPPSTAVPEVTGAPPRPASSPGPPASRALALRTTREPSAESRPDPARAPHRGVRGRVVSPSVTLADGSPGVDPAAWEAIVYALVTRPGKRSVDRIGIAHHSAPGSERGDFEIDLPTGPYLVLVRHRVDREGAAPRLEAWYAYADVLESQRVPVDLGIHAFAAAAVTGAVVDETGATCGGASVDLSDERRVPGDPLTRGVHLTFAAGADGRFAISLAARDGSEIVARLSARSGSASASVEDVRMGDRLDLVLQAAEPEADVVFEVPWSEGLRLFVHATERQLGFARDVGKRPPTGLVEERRALVPGRYVAETFRRTGDGRDEWSRSDVVLAQPGPARIRLEPDWRPARTVGGRVPAGTRVSWVTRIESGATFERGVAVAGDDGRFALRGVPTDALLLRHGSAWTRVPAGPGPETDAGDLASR
jgi:hypothetical protein